MKKFLIYLSTFLFLLGVSVAFAGVYIEDFEDGIDPPWEASGDYVIEDGKFHMLYGETYGGDYAHGNIWSWYPNEFVYHFEGKIYMFSDQFNLHPEIFFSGATPSDRNMHLELAFYGEFMEIRVALLENGVAIGEQSLGPLTLGIWYSWSITLHENHVSIKINNDEYELFHGLFQRPQSVSESTASIHGITGPGIPLEYYADNLVAYTSTDPTKHYLLAFFDDSVEAGTIEGRGRRPRIANYRLRLMRRMLRSAVRHIEKDRIGPALNMLNRALRRCDGEPRPPDYIVGEAVPQLMAMIEHLIAYLTDDDGDGLSEHQGDCNDTDDTIYPGAPEICDSQDNQCPGDSGYGEIDEDCAFLETYIFERMWPELHSQWYFSSPAYVATDNNDLVYISDYNNYQIQVFTANGDLVSKWPITEYGEYELGETRAITVDQDGFVYVVAGVSNSESSILKLNPSGEIVDKIGSYADFPGTCGFSNPCAIDVDNSGNLYVTDEANQRIEKLAPDGTLITTWGSLGSEPGQFHDPTGIAVDRKNNWVYVLDSRNLRTQKFTTEGEYLAQWQSIDSVTDFGGVGIAVDQQGYVYVSNTVIDEIRKFTDTGELEATFIDIAYGSYGIAIDSGGYIYSADFHGNRVQKISPDGTQNWIWTSAGTANGYFDWPWDVALDSNGNVYVADQNNARIQKFDSQGNFISAWQGPGGPIAIDTSDNVYVMGESSVLKYDANGGLLTEWGSQGSGDGQFNWVNGIAVDQQGYVYVVDAGNYRIQKFTSNGTFVTKWGSQGSGNGQFILPWAIDVDSNGNVYVTDSDQHNVQIFTTDGEFVAKWEEQGFGAPRGIAIDESNNVYVCSVKGYIQKLTSEGVLITEFGDSGSEPGYLAGPNGIEVDSAERIYVAETNNNRIQVFTKILP